METHLSPTLGTVATDPVHTLAEELPSLYRTILDLVAQLERIGERSEAGRIRMNATAAYSGAWDESGRNRLLSLIARADRIIAGRAHPRGWAMRRRSAPAR
ncbi:MAG TPA: hypothetical protein VFO73_07775 [Candidatus Limnocylindrales bacterium]|nr:hypothetical protein [Candidatus Limnocylindrales bacterium]